MTTSGQQNSNGAPLLEVDDLKVHFAVKHSLFSRARPLRAVDGVTFKIDRGETLGLVGESGCGKTTLGRAIVRLADPVSGSIRIECEDIGRRNGDNLRACRQVQMIFQDPYGSLDPRMTIGQIVVEGLEIHRIGGSGDRRRRMEELLAAVGLDAAYAGRYPHEMSGGQRQRVGVARALAVEPKLIVCDEPVSALDVSVQAQIVNLLADLQRERGVAYLFVAHDLAVVEHLSRRIMVMYLGKIVEMGEASAVTATAQHPYTRALVSAVPQIDPDSQRKRIVLSGEVPSPADSPPGCPFHPRCPLAQERCRQEAPALREVLPGHWASCHFAPLGEQFTQS